MLHVFGAGSHDKASEEFVLCESQADSLDQMDIQTDADLTPSEPQTPDKALPSPRPNFKPLSKRPSPEGNEKAAKKARKGPYTNWTFEEELAFFTGVTQAREGGTAQGVQSAQSACVYIAKQLLTRDPQQVRCYYKRAIKKVKAIIDPTDDTYLPWESQLECLTIYWHMLLALGLNTTPTHIWWKIEFPAKKKMIELMQQALAPIVEKTRTGGLQNMAEPAPSSWSSSQVQPGTVDTMSHASEPLHTDEDMPVDSGDDGSVLSTAPEECAAPQDAVEGIPCDMDEQLALGLPVLLGAVELPRKVALLFVPLDSDAQTRMDAAGICPNLELTCRTKTPVVQVIRHLSGLWDAAGQQEGFKLHPHPQYEVLRGAGVCWEASYTDAVLSVGDLFNALLRPEPFQLYYTWQPGPAAPFTPDSGLPTPEPLRVCAPQPFIAGIVMPNPAPLGQTDPAQSFSAEAPLGTSDCLPAMPDHEQQPTSGNQEISPAAQPPSVLQNPSLPQCDAVSSDSEGMTTAIAPEAMAWSPQGKPAPPARPENLTVDSGNPSTSAQLAHAPLAPAMEAPGSWEGNVFALLPSRPPQQPEGTCELAGDPGRAVHDTSPGLLVDTSADMSAQVCSHTMMEATVCTVPVPVEDTSPHGYTVEGPTLLGPVHDHLSTSNVSHGEVALQPQVTMGERAPLDGVQQVQDGMDAVGQERRDATPSAGALAEMHAGGLASNHMAGTDHVCQGLAVVATNLGMPPSEVRGVISSQLDMPRSGDASRTQIPAGTEKEPLFRADAVMAGGPGFPHVYGRGVFGGDLAQNQTPPQGMLYGDLAGNQPPLLMVDDLPDLSDISFDMDAMWSSHGFPTGDFMTSLPGSPVCHIGDVPSLPPMAPHDLEMSGGFGSPFLPSTSLPPLQNPANPPTADQPPGAPQQGGDLTVEAEQGRGACTRSGSSGEGACRDGEQGAVWGNKARGREAQGRSAAGRQREFVGANVLNSPEAVNPRGLRVQSKHGKENEGAAGQAMGGVDNSSGVRKKKRSGGRKPRPVASGEAPIPKRQSSRFLKGSLAREADPNGDQGWASHGVAAAQASQAPPASPSAPDTATLEGLQTLDALFPMLGTLADMPETLGAAPNDTTHEFEFQTPGPAAPTSSPLAGCVPRTPYAVSERQSSLSRQFAQELGFGGDDSDGELDFGNVFSQASRGVSARAGNQGPAPPSGTGHPTFQVRQESRPFSLGGDFSLGSFPFPSDSWMGITNSHDAEETLPVGDRPFAALFPR